MPLTRFIPCSASLHRALLTAVATLGTLAPSTRALTLNNESIKFTNVEINGGSLLTLTGSAVGNAYGPFTGSGALLKNGSGAWTLNGQNTYTGGTTVRSGTLGIGSFGSVVGPITLGDIESGDASISLLSQSANLANDIILTSHGSGVVSIGGQSSGAPSVFTGNIVLNRTATFVGGNDDRTTFTGVISGDVGVLTIAGLRTTLDASNTFTGTVLIEDGATLQLNNDGTRQVLPTQSNVHTSQSGTLQIVGDNTVGSLTGASDSVVQLAHGGVPSAALSVGANHASTTFAGSVRDGSDGALSLRKIGDGRLTLSGASTYSGGTTVVAGTLRADSTTAFGAGAVNVDGGTLDLAGFAIANDVSLFNGTLEVGGPAAGVGSLAWHSGAVLAFTLDADPAAADFLAIAGALTKQGPGAFAFAFDATSFDALTGQTFTLLSFASTDFTASDFSFTNGGGFEGFFAFSGDTLTFTYGASAIPEPSTYAAIVGALMLALALSRRRHA